MNDEAHIFDIRFDKKVSIVIERRPATSPWGSVVVSIVDIHLDDSVASEDYLANCLNAQANMVRYEGIPLRLYSDAAGSYHENLMAQKPQFYLCGEYCHVCGIHPQKITVDPHEAEAFESGEGNTVLSTDLYGELWRLVDAFAIQWHRPRVMKKRKRKDWSKDEKNGASSKEVGRG